MMFRKKNKLWILLIIFIASCSGEIDFTKDLELNSSEPSWKFKRKQLINSKIFKIDNGHSESIPYVNLKLDEVTNFKAVVVLNDGYEFGNLREIKYRLGGFTSYVEQNPYYDENGLSDRNKTEIDFLYKKLINQYGEPDSMKLSYYYKFFVLGENLDTLYTTYGENFDINDEAHRMPFDFMDIPKDSKVDSIALNENFPTIYSKWINSDAVIIFHAESNGVKDQFDKEYNGNSYLRFQIPDFEENLSRIQDSIRNTYKPKDIVYVDIGNVEWICINENIYNYEIRIKINRAGRIYNEEERDVTNVQYDILLTDNFDNELCRITNYDLKLNPPLEKGTANVFDRYITLKYNSNSKMNEIQKFESTRKYANSFEVKTKTIVNAVRYADGTVLKK